jgi:hypothetical protein
MKEERNEELDSDQASLATTLIKGIRYDIALRNCFFKLRKRVLAPISSSDDVKQVMAQLSLRCFFQLIDLHAMHTKADLEADLRKLKDCYYNQWLQSND